MHSSISVTLSWFLLAYPKPQLDSCSRRRTPEALVCHIYAMLCLVSELYQEQYTGIPWQTGLRRGTALEEDGDRILVREEGFYFVYSQVSPFIVISLFYHKGVLLVCLRITRLLFLFFIFPFSAEKKGWACTYLRDLEERSDIEKGNANDACVHNEPGRKC